MKKLLVLFCSAGVLFMAGCGGDKVTPEEVGKKYMEKRFPGAEVNLTDLAYNVVESGDDMATVSIEGTITYKEQIFLKKKNGAWVVTEEAPEASEVVGTDAEPAPAKEEPVHHESEPEAEPVKEVHDTAAKADAHAPAEAHAEEAAHH